MKCLVVLCLLWMLGYSFCSCHRTIDYVYTVDQVFQNETLLPVEVTVYSKIPARPVYKFSVEPGKNHLDTFTFDGYDGFNPVDSRFITDSVTIVFDARIRLFYPYRGSKRSDNCITRNVYCFDSYEKQIINQWHSQYTYRINQSDLVKAK